MPAQRLKALLSVKVIGIDHGKGLVNNFGRRKHSLRRAPRLGAARRNSKSRRKIVDLLKHILHRNALLKARANRLTERVFDIPANYEDYLAEAGARCVIHREIENGLAGGTNRIDLFQSAVAGSHAGGKD